MRQHKLEETKDKEDDVFVLLNESEHRRYLNVAATALQPALPNDIVLKNILPFLALELPSHTFEGEN